MKKIDDNMTGAEIDYRLKMITNNLDIYTKENHALRNQLSMIYQSFNHLLRLIQVNSNKKEAYKFVIDWLKKQIGDIDKQKFYLNQK